MFIQRTLIRLQLHLPNHQVNSIGMGARILESFRGHLAFHSLHIDGHIHDHIHTRTGLIFFDENKMKYSRTMYGNQKIRVTDDNCANKIDVNSI